MKLIAKKKLRPILVNTHVFQTIIWLSFIYIIIAFGSISDVSLTFRNFFNNSMNFSHNMCNNISSFRGLRRYFTLSSNSLAQFNLAHIWSGVFTFAGWKKDSSMVFTRGGLNTKCITCKPLTSCAREGARYHRRYMVSFAENRFSPSLSVIHARWWFYIAPL